MPKIYVIDKPVLLSENLNKEVKPMITRRDVQRPIRAFDRLARLLDELWEDEELRSGWRPHVDVKETEDALTFFVDLPGVKEEDIEVEFAGDVLTIRGKREFEEKEERNNYVRIERSFGAFQRSFTVGVPVESDKITATYKDGILTVRVPKAESSRARRIAVTKAE
ncbi:MAG: Hsp20/alpha crystallin family protein [Fimbriimonadales bacterium]|nr:Hsp20/alpha crystallin family protein [Fimbriimonadales bacterium]